MSRQNLYLSVRRLIHEIRRLTCMPNCLLAVISSCRQGSGEACEAIEDFAADMVCAASDLKTQEWWAITHPMQEQPMSELSGNSGCE
jgi:hypothetical protein